MECSQNVRLIEVSESNEHCGGSCRSIKFGRKTLPGKKRVLQKGFGSGPHCGLRDCGIASASRSQYFRTNDGQAIRSLSPQRYRVTGWNANDCDSGSKSRESRKLLRLDARRLFQSPRPERWSSARASTGLSKRRTDPVRHSTALATKPAVCTSNAAGRPNPESRRLHEWPE